MELRVSERAWLGFEEKIELLEGRSTRTAGCL